jgi:hypothetical protein
MSFARRALTTSLFRPCSTLGIEGLEIAAVSVQPAMVAAGGLVRDAELLKMLERAAGLKSNV